QRERLATAHDGEFDWAIGLIEGLEKVGQLTDGFGANFDDTIARLQAALCRAIILADARDQHAVWRGQEAEQLRGRRMRFETIIDAQLYLGRSRLCNASHHRAESLDLAFELLAVGISGGRGVELRFQIFQAS